MRSGISSESTAGRSRCSRTSTRSRRRARSSWRAGRSRWRARASPPGASPSFPDDVELESTRFRSGVLVCGPVWLDGPVGGFVVGVGVGDRLGLLHLARRVVLGRVDGVDLHRLVADVGDVVPGTGRNDDAPAVGYLVVEGQFILAGSHLGSTPATVESNELVGVGVLLQSDVAVDRNRHEGDLHVVAAPGDGAVVRVLDRLGLQVERLGTGTNVFNAHGLTIALALLLRWSSPSGTVSRRRLCA